jgi:hypothetical protein
MDRIGCSVWNNGGRGWGLKVLGGPRVRGAHFRRDQSTVYLKLDDALCPINIKKKSFWTPTCGELISVAVRNWIVEHQLKIRDRVWLEIVEPYRTFKAVRMQSTVVEKEIA